MNKKPYDYNATLDRVIDGDSGIIDIDLGFDIISRQTETLPKRKSPNLSGVWITVMRLEARNARKTTLRE